MSFRQEWQAIQDALVASCDEEAPPRPQAGCYRTKEGANLYVAWARKLNPYTTFPIEARPARCGHWRIWWTGRRAW